MSTERKPGSRGVRTTDSLGGTKKAPNRLFEGDRDPKKKPKGSTKTASRRQSFKRKPGK